MKIESISIKNFKGIESIDTKIDGKNVYLIGGNGTGKTSFIDAIWCGLTGKKLPPEPTHKGAKKGVIEINLGDFIARTKFTKGRPARFEIENTIFSEESEMFKKSPRSYLENRIGVINFDVNEFFSKSGSEKVKYFSKMMNIDFSDIDSDIEELYESRKFDKKALSNIRNSQNYYDKQKSEMDYVSVVELSNQIEKEQEKSRQYNRIEQGLEDRERMTEAIDEEIHSLIKKKEKIEEEKKSAMAWLNNDVNIPISDEDLNELIRKRNASEVINEEIREAKEAKQADEQAEKYEKEIEYATNQIESLKKKKAARISENINIEGLSYDMYQERFLYEGIPFDSSQINTASQLIAGMKIAYMGLKDLKIIKVDASLIDKDEFDKVLEWAEKNEIQLFVELVDREARQLQICVDE